jgi:hypothetical protein
VEVLVVLPLSSEAGDVFRKAILVDAIEDVLLNNNTKGHLSSFVPL